MKIETRIKQGVLKGYTIRKSKNGWYDLYSSGGVSQTTGKHTLEEINQLVEEMQRIGANKTEKKILNFP